MNSALDTSTYTPRRLGRYDLISNIAAGGMGEVHLARLKSMEGVEKLVAIKLLLPQFAANKEIVSMFVHEARIASRMNHPNICQVFELGMEGSDLFICMEFLRGVPLTTILSSHSPSFPMSPRIATGLIHQACTGLHYAHDLKDEAGEPLEIVHRDITPSNLMLTHTGLVKILDFGVVKARNAEHKTRTGALKGKFAYMSPEQLRAEELDRRADVFALGIVLFELLANEPLFNKGNEYETLRAICDLDIPTVRDFQSSVPQELSDLVARALSRDRNERFGSAKEMAQAICEVMEPHGGIAGPDELGDFINARYAKELDKGAEMVQHARELSRSGQLENLESSGSEKGKGAFEAETSALRRRPQLGEKQESRSEPNTLEALPQDPQESRQRSSSGVAIGLVAISLAVLALAAVLLLRPNGKEEDGDKALVYQGQLQETEPAQAQSIEPAGAEAALDEGETTATKPDAAGEPDAPSPNRPNKGHKTRSKGQCAGIQDKAKRNRCYLSQSQKSFTKCLAMHEELARSTSGLTLKIELSPAGKVEEAQLLPASAANTPLGTCLRKAASKVQFGPQGEAVRFSIPLKIRRR